MNTKNSMSGDISQDEKAEGTLNNEIQKDYSNQEDSLVKLSKDQLLEKLFKDMSDIQTILDEDDHNSMDTAYIIYKNLIDAVKFNNHVKLSEEITDSIETLGGIFFDYEKKQQQKILLQKERREQIEKQQQAFRNKVKDDAENAIELMVEMKFRDIENGEILYEDVFDVMKKYKILHEFIEKNELDEPHLEEKMYDYLVRISIGRSDDWWDVIDLLVEQLTK